MFKKYYLAYGSNLNLGQMHHRCRHAKAIGKTVLKGYRLVYKGDEDEFAYLTIEKCEGSVVPLGIFEISFFDMLSLDRYEGFPWIYSSFIVPIKVGEKVKNALIYVMNEEFDYHLPSEEYVATCIEGYEDFGFDQSVLDKALVDTKDMLAKKLTKKLK